MKLTVVQLKDVLLRWGSGIQVGYLFLLTSSEPLKQENQKGKVGVRVLEWAAQGLR